MDNTQDLCNIEGDDEDEGEGRNDDSCCISSTSYRLFGRQMSIHQMMGGGKAADVILWKRQHVSCGIVVVATVAWILFEQSGLSFLLICSDVLLILVVLLFLRANYAVFRKKHLRTLPELVLSEEMVINAAASFRVKINYVLLLAHDITLGRDFRLFFKFKDGGDLSMALVRNWKRNLIFYTCIYRSCCIHGFVFYYHDETVNEPSGIILSITVPALYNKHQDHVDRFAGLLHQKFSNNYRVVDESVSSRFPLSSTKDKDSFCIDISLEMGTFARIILSITVPALYNKHQDHVDRFADLIHQKFSNRYKAVDDSVISRFARSSTKAKFILKID
ncbi:unnamed protein product [Camellia sinensis]